MKVAVAVHGTRGDVEPGLAVARELVSRGHQVRLAVPPNLIAFTESAGFASAVSYGPDSQRQLEAEVFRELWKLRNPVTVLRQARDYIVEGWAEMNATLVDLAAGADLILTGTTYQEVAANVAESRGIPMASLHYFPARANTGILPLPLPLPLVSPAWAVGEWAHWRLLKPAEDEQRRALGLPRAHARAARRIVDYAAAEIQAYDPVFFPGLAGQWGGRRPLVGSLTLELPTDADPEVQSWIGAGPPPVYFGFGSMPVPDPAGTVAMISAVTADLGLRALISTGIWELDEGGFVTGISTADHVKILSSVNHAQVFPQCRAAVHHGGSGTTAAGVRAGLPALALWVSADQPIWANRIKRLGVGIAQRFSGSTPESLRRNLRTVLEPRFAARAREAAAGMIPPALSAARTADVLERAVAGGRQIAG